MNDVKRINKIAIPILITYITGIFFSLGDQAIIGRVSIEGYAAISVVSNLLYTVTGTLGIISLTLNIIGAKKLSQNDLDGYSDLFSTIVTISFCIGIGFEIICLIFGRIFLSNFYNMSGNALNYAYIYLAISGLSLLLNMLMFVYSAYFKSIERTSILFKSSIIANIINIAFDYVLVFGKLGFPKLGVAGAAIGSILGLAANTLIYFITFRKYSDFKYIFMIKRNTVLEVLRSYIPLVGQDFIESTAFVFIITAIITKLGIISIGAYNLINVIVGIIVLPIYAYGNAIMTIMAKCTSDDTSKFMHRIPLISIGLVLSIILPLFFIILINPATVFSIITNKAPLVDAAIASLAIGLLIQIPNSINNIYKYSLNALEDSKWVLYYHCIVSGFSLLLIYYFSKIFFNGIIGIFFGMGMNYLLLALGFYIRYSYILRKKWSCSAQSATAGNLADN